MLIAASVPCFVCMIITGHGGQQENIRLHIPVFILADGLLAHAKKTRQHLIAASFLSFVGALRLGSMEITSGYQFNNNLLSS